MSSGYRAVGWNRFKRRYDLWAWGCIAFYLAVFVAAMLDEHPDVTIETILLRATGSCALVLLHVILAIGPLCRLDPRLLPLLYNRRHLGVSMFLLALVHGAFAMVQYHAGGDVNPFVSLLTADGEWSRLSDWPFQPFGAAALLILFVMAATSHDFWLHNLSAPVWKALHMGVYVAYALLLAHVGFGVMRDEVSAIVPLYLGMGAVSLLGLHVVAGWFERRRDASRSPEHDGWLLVGDASQMEEGRARVVVAAGERVAVFRWEGKIAAVSAVCQHQNGPLGEGRVIDGCITCPWHGYQYRPEDGCSPPPFTERVSTFRVEVRQGVVWLDSCPAAPGTPQVPARCEGHARATADDPGFFVGYLGQMPRAIAQRTHAKVLGFFVLALVLAAGLAPSHGPFKPATFEYGVVRTFEGVLSEHPQPVLLVDRPMPAGRGDVPAQSSWLLVAPWKHGAQELVAGLDGQRVRVTGSLVYRLGQVMLELSARPDPLRGDPALPAALPLGEVELRGQIVDSKCWLGVMNPADTVTHRACAVRCLSGGIPPLFVAHDADGAPVSLLLVGRDGRALNGEILDLVAEPLVVRGAVERQASLLVLRAEPGEMRRDE